MSARRWPVLTVGALAVAAVGVALAAWHPARAVTAGGVAAAYLSFCVAVFDRHCRGRQRGAVLSSAGDAVMLVTYASQSGFAQQLAEQTAHALQAAGTPAHLLSFADLKPGLLTRCRQVLFVVSTTGEGDAPDSAADFAARLSAAAARPDGTLRDLRYGILALGDRSYARFCAFGHALSAWLHRQQAQPLFDMVEVDNGDTGALRHWQNHLSALAGGAEIADWEPPRYAAWTLCERRLLNPGSAGAAAYHLALIPAQTGGNASEDPMPAWQAGDIAEIGPRHALPEIQYVLARLSLDGAARVRCDGADMTLAEALATRLLLPEPQLAMMTAAMSAMTAQALIDALPALPHREYSIASLPQDGRLELLVRQNRHADGGLGLASGWLTEQAPLGAPIALRIRANRGFHPPPDARPLLLIGNGTGLAGLRAHLKARAAAGHHRNWLLFGERSAAHDAFYRDELQAWREAGVLQRLDLVYSRDGASPRYVQDAVRAAAGEVRDWIGEGACVHVCGSLQGMAAGVHEALEMVLGEAELAQLAQAGRYRRDVY